MTADWRLLAYYIRKPCKACKLPLSLQEWLYQQYQQRRPIREIEGDLLRMGYAIGDHTLYKHRKHHAQLLAKLSQPADPDHARIERDLLKSQLEKLKLARTRDELLQAALDALKRELPPEQFNKVLDALNSEAGEP